MARPRHVLNERLGIARYVPADVGGKEPRPLIVKRPRRGPDDNFDGLSFIERLLSRETGNKCQGAKQRTRSDRKPAMLSHKNLFSG
jgi:hypothetical protein